MKIAMAMMAVVAGALMVALWLVGEGALGRALSASSRTGLQFLPILLLAIFMMGAIEELLPKAFIETWLSDAAGGRGILIAWLGGILTPAGSLVGLPIVAGLMKSGVSAAVLITYMISMATLSLVRLPLEIGLVGFKLTALRVAACLFLPPLAGLLVRLARPLYGAI